jgi:hypothetical protein
MTCAFSSTLTTTVFSHRSLRRFEASPRRAAPKGHKTFISYTAPHPTRSPTTQPRLPRSWRTYRNKLTRREPFKITRSARLPGDTPSHRPSRRAAPTRFAWSYQLRRCRRTPRPTVPLQTRADSWHETITAVVARLMRSRRRRSTKTCMVFLLVVPPCQGMGLTRTRLDAMAGRFLARTTIGAVVGKLHIAGQ